VLVTERTKVLVGSARSLGSVVRPGTLTLRRLIVIDKVPLSHRDLYLDLQKLIVVDGGSRSFWIGSGSFSKVLWTCTDFKFCLSLIN
jgi:hypothetical protein